MATSKIPTPSFYHGQNYNIFKKEVRIWQKITNIEPKHQALHLICNLPGRDKDPLGIKNSLLEKADDDDLNTNDGVKKLFKLMDEFLGKDELEEAYELREDYDSPCEAYHGYRIPRVSLAKPGRLSLHPS